MYEFGDVPADWQPGTRCCLECGNSEPLVSLIAVTNLSTSKQALACTRHAEQVAAALN
ncbi:hypothetical protein [Streptomyces sp. bgisy153]|uniref:hypothetical protein n=1 Tax=Streptomyces sp. bgisy153 TaxID=3413793 RepID=UPI003D717DBF